MSVYAGYGAFSYDNQLEAQSSPSLLSLEKSTKGIWHIGAEYQFQNGLLLGLGIRRNLYWLSLVNSTIDPSKANSFFYGMGYYWPVSTRIGYGLNYGRFYSSLSGSLTGYCNTCASNPNYPVFSSSKWNLYGYEYVFDKERSDFYNRLNLELGITVKAGFQLHKNLRVGGQLNYSSSLFENYRWTLIEYKQDFFNKVKTNEYTVIGKPVNIWWWGIEAAYTFDLKRDEK